MLAAHTDLLCPRLVVYGADFANCNGEYVLSNLTVGWAPHRPVYKHVGKNRWELHVMNGGHKKLCVLWRVIFWNAGGLGWSIGKTAYLKTGSHWHRSGLDAAEPWQGDWEKNVIVECTEGVGEDQAEDEGWFIIFSLPAVDCLWSGFSEWSSCSSSCGEGLQKRERKALQPAQNGGLACAGEVKEERACKSKPCPSEYQKSFTFSELIFFFISPLHLVCVRTMEWMFTILWRGS